MKYLMVVLKHKWFVFLAYLRLRELLGHRLKMSLWQAIVHDWTKFLPVQFGPYRHWFHVAKDNPSELNIAWLHHQNHEPHHWGYWISRSPIGDDVDPVLCMPDKYVDETIADWMGAGRAYSGKSDMTKWLKNNLSRLQFHMRSEQRVVYVLNALGYWNATKWLVEVPNG